MPSSATARSPADAKPTTRGPAAPRGCIACRGPLSSIPVTSNAGIHEPVAIVGGSGALGSALALRFALAGIPVLLGSREESRAVEALKRIVTLIGPRMDDRHPI